MARNNGNTGFSRQFVPDICISNARISGRPNFSGVERLRDGQIVNGEGNRNFCVDIPAEGVMLDDGSNRLATPNELIQMGWPIKPHWREDDEAPITYYLPIQVKFTVRPPEIYLAIGDKLHTITESEIDTFDGRSFSKINLVVHPSIGRDRRTGEPKITAYLAEGWFYLKMSRFAQQWYAEHPEEEEEFAEE